MPAATRAPNVNTRMISVSGSVSKVDLPISSLLLSSVALVMLASPVSSIRSSGCAFAAASTAASESTTVFLVVLESPGRSNVTSAECPSAEICPAALVGTDDVVHALGALEALGHVGDGRLEPGVAGRELAALDQHLLARLVLEGAVDDLGGLAGLAGTRRLRVDLLLRQDVESNCHRDEHERQPSEDGLLTMLDAPAPNPCGDVARCLHGFPFGSLIEQRQCRCRAGVGTSGGRPEPTP